MKTSYLSSPRSLLRSFVDQETLILIYNAIVRPYFDYCEVWDVFSEAESKRLQKLQNRAARIILNVNNDVEHTMYDGAQLWSSVPKEIRESKSLSSFRKKIAAHIVA